MDTSKLPLYVLLLVTLVRGVSYLAVVPPWQAPEETAHFAYAESIARNGYRALRSSAVDPNIHQEIYTSAERFQFSKFTKPNFFSTGKPPYPPLYYVTAAFLLRPLRATDLMIRFYTLRLVSVVLGLLVVLFTYFTARELYPDQPAIWLCSGVFVSFLPQFIFVSSSIGPDSLVSALGAVVIFLLILMIRDGRSKSKIGLVISAAALGLIVKPSAVILIPITFLTLLFCLGRSAPVRKGLLMWMAFGFAITCLSLVVCFKFGVFSKTLASYFGVKRFIGVEYYILGYVLPNKEWWNTFYRVLFQSFWLTFGWMGFALKPAWYVLLKSMVAMSAIGLGILLTNVLRDPSRLTSWQKSGLVLLFLSSLFSIMDAHLYHGIRLQLAQGKHLFVTLPATAILITIGIREILPKRFLNLGSLLFIIFFIVLDCVSLLGYIFPTYHFHT